MGLFSSIKKRRDEKLHTDAMKLINPYVSLWVTGKMTWFRWELVPSMKAAGIVPKHLGLPVCMSKEECLAVNGGVLPDYWGEVQFAWRSQEQKQAFYAKYPERFRPKQSEERPATPKRNVDSD